MSCRTSSPVLMWAWNAIRPRIDRSSVVTLMGRLHVPCPIACVICSLVWGLKLSKSLKRRIWRPLGRPFPRTCRSLWLRCKGLAVRSFCEFRAARGTDAPGLSQGSPPPCAASSRDVSPCIRFCCVQQYRLPCLTYCQQMPPHVYRSSPAGFFLFSFLVSFSYQVLLATYSL